jgi:hypothetical protein
MNDKDDPWKQLVEAAKTAPLDEEEMPAPEVSVKTLRESVQALFLALTWRKWSLLAALLAGLIFVVFYLMRDRPAPPQPIIPAEPPVTPETP